MSSNKLKLEVNDKVANLILDQPEKHNAFDDIIIKEIKDTIDNIGQNPEIRVLVLSGSGKSFSAGADLGWMRRMSEFDEDENFSDARSLADMLNTLNLCPKATIAKVHGPAIGGGVGLIACCDMAIAADTAIFSFSESRLGLTPSTIGPYIIKSIGSRNARRFFLTAERFDALTALEIGLVNVVVPANDLDQYVSDLTKTLSKNSPNAIRECKKLIDYIDGRNIDRPVLEYTAKHIARVRSSDEGKEGITAFLEKRKPNW